MTIAGLRHVRHTLPTRSDQHDAAHAADHDGGKGTAPHLVPAVRSEDQAGHAGKPDITETQVPEPGHQEVASDQGGRRGEGGPDPGRFPEQHCPGPRRAGDRDSRDSDQRGRDPVNIKVESHHPDASQCEEEGGRQQLREVAGGGQDGVGGGQSGRGPDRAGQLEPVRLVGEPVGPPAKVPAGQRGEDGPGEGG